MILGMFNSWVEVVVLGPMMLGLCLLNIVIWGAIILGLCSVIGLVLFAIAHDVFFYVKQKVDKRP
jgi:hypothetical protein